MSAESLRVMLHRIVDEIADKLVEREPATKPKKVPRKRVARGPVIVTPEPIGTPEQRARAQAYVRRALGR